MPAATSLQPSNCLTSILRTTFLAAAIAAVISVAMPLTASAQTQVTIDATAGAATVSTSYTLSGNTSFTSAFSPTISSWAVVVAELGRLGMKTMLGAAAVVVAVAKS